MKLSFGQVLIAVCFAAAAAAAAAAIAAVDSTMRNRE